MVESGTEWYERIERNINQLQTELRKIDSTNSLLKIVNVDDMGINYDFGGIERARYSGKTKGEALDLYIEDLRKQVDGINSHR